MLTRNGDLPSGAGEPEGQALVEFALVIPIFLLIVFAIIEGGLLFSGQSSLVSAVRETARYAAPYRVVDSAGANNTCPTVAQKVIDQLGTNPLTTDPAVTIPTITYTWKPNDILDGNYYVTVRVKVDYKFPLYVPLVGNILDGLDGVSDNKLRLSAQEEMRVENDPLASSDSTVTC